MVLIEILGDVNKCLNVPIISFNINYAFEYIDYILYLLF